MLNDNLECKNSVYIDQNSKKSFNIHQSKEWKHCVDIHIDQKQKINFLNLYLILKSYACSSIYLTSDFLVRIKNPDEMIITEKSSNLVIENMSFSEFQRWYHFRIKHDGKYFKKDGFYCFSFTFNHRVFDTNILNNLVPIYPWKDSILDEISNYEIDGYIKEEKIRKKDVVIKNNKEEIIKNKAEIKKLKEVIEKKGYEFKKKNIITSLLLKALDLVVVLFHKIKSFFIK